MLQSSCRSEVFTNIMSSTDGRKMVRFSVVSFAPPGSSLAVIGSSASLGKWSLEKAVTMKPRLANARLQSEPDFHWADVDIPEAGSERIEYKFVERGSDGVKWEELGGHQNRVLELETQEDGQAILLPVVRFAEPGGGESDHTARFYQGVKGAWRDIHSEGAGPALCGFMPQASLAHRPVEVPRHLSSGELSD